MFLSESDNESAPSPVKSQPKVPYCKTYEQMRLEEIQAESAAYYSYEASNYDLHQRQMSKIIGTKRWIRTSKTKKEELSKELNFKILSLEEIRQRKRERTAKTLTDITSVSEPSSLIEAKSMKRRSIDEQCDKESANSAKKCKISSEFAKSSEPVVKIQPIKLRRSLKMETQIQPCKMQVQTEIQPCEGVIINERLATDSQDDQTSCYEEKEESHSNETSYCERLENYVDELVNRKVDIEIRLCDSSTNEEKTQVQPEQASDDRSSVATYTEDIETSLLADQPYDQQYTQTDEEYLRLDTSADDIMRDIEDLLN